MGVALVTGGAGFIGANLVRHLLAHTRDDIVVVDKLTYAANPRTLDAWRQNRRVRFVRADIADRPVIDRLLSEERPWAVLNLAAETHVDRSIDSPAPFIDTNVTGTFQLLEAARRYQASSPAAERARFRFLHVSTDEVYGSLGPDGFFSESTAYAPNSPYAASKAAGDHLVRAYHHTYGLPTLITNCSNNYGPYQHPEKLIPLTILNALDARPLPIYGDGGNVRDWLHVDDHCRGMVAVLDHGQPGRQYNIGANNEQTTVAIVDRLCDVLEQVRPAASNPAMGAAGATAYRALKRFVPDRPGHDRRYAIDASRIRTELGWSPTHSFDSGLGATVQWYLDHAEWYQAGRIGYDRERLGLGTPNA